uniref:Uncharacterized protein n=1 Tax=Myoviridae sp. ctcyQ27 TaxID=2825139 RepID=A0A8S5UFL2_9CAUD|nr:MAG TPA: hypothetical protein [Myoviridae sp. ctcyQ27]
MMNISCIINNSDYLKYHVIRIDSSKEKYQYKLMKSVSLNIMEEK